MSHFVSFDDMKSEKERSITQILVTYVFQVSFFLIRSFAKEDDERAQQSSSESDIEVCAMQLFSLQL